MNFRIILCLAMLTGAVAGPVAANDWTRLTGAEIEAALNDTTLQYVDAEQKFYASGKTLYDHGRPSWGNWAVRGDEYCSQWPPADGWACYRMDRNAVDGRLRFVTKAGATTEGTILE